MNTTFEGKVAIVTGGGNGIGRSAALKLAGQGCHVLISGRTESSLQDVRAQSDRIEFVRADIKNEVDAIALAQKAIALWGRIDILVNNAGMFGLSSIDVIKASFFEEIMLTNVIAPALLIRECLDALAKAQGCIINISSAYGHKAVAQVGTYGASKAALEHLTGCLALELAPKRIKVNCVAPGPTETEILRKSGLSEEMIKQFNEEIIRAVPLARRGTPDEVADSIVKLAGPAANWITGRVISVDGGLSVA